MSIGSDVQPQNFFGVGDISINAPQGTSSLENFELVVGSMGPPQLITHDDKSGCPRNVEAASNVVMMNDSVKKKKFPPSLTEF